MTTSKATLATMKKKPISVTIFGAIDFGMSVTNQFHCFIFSAPRYGIFLVVDSRMD